MKIDNTPLPDLDPNEAWAPFVPADGEWTDDRIAHLYRRAAFGARPSDIQAARQRSPSDVVDAMIGQGEPADFRAEMALLSKAALATNNVQNVSTVWLRRMLQSPAGLVEKMVLFWHGHFATGADKVDEHQMMHNQNALFRQHALGDFGKLVRDVARDPAMLLYLDSAYNRKAHPNENFAREIMELFCLGEGHYSEQDIRELARCFTGWEVRRGRFRFNRYQHDPAEKSLFNQSGPFGGEKGIDIVLEQPSLERFLVRKLVRYFVMDEPPLPDRLVEPLAMQFRKDNLRIAPTLKRILSSQLMFSRHARARKVRSPLELSVSLLRAFDGTTNAYRLADLVGELGQRPYYPPNVKGWDGGRAWINTSTLLARANTVLEILTSENSRFGGKSFNDYARDNDMLSVEGIMDHVQTLLLAVPLDAATRQQLVSRSQSNQDRMLIRVVHAITTLPQYQLC